MREFAFHRHSISHWGYCAVAGIIFKGICPIGPTDSFLLFLIRGTWIDGIYGGLTMHFHFCLQELTASEIARDGVMWLFDNQEMLVCGMGLEPSSWLQKMPQNDVLD